ncbi:MAG: metallophosphoesterase [Betaproteobacteria bacterium]
MRKILHISDLHFGRVDSAVVRRLREQTEELGPDLIVVSGDLTQRGRRREFIDARNFLDSLSAPRVVVPGNHDIPLYNVVARFLAPLGNYQRLIGAAEGAYVDDEIAVVGVNTARSLAFKGGRINMAQVHRARDVFCESESCRVRILVTHHPFGLGPAGEDAHLVGRAAIALTALRECMPDILLSGHMHAAEVGTTAQRYALGGSNAIVVQAGTATSTRVRGEPNSFNVLSVEHECVTIQRYAWKPPRDAFSLVSTHAYSRHGSGWMPDPISQDSAD